MSKTGLIPGHAWGCTRAKHAGGMLQGNLSDFDFNQSKKVTGSPKVTKSQLAL